MMKRMERRGIPLKRLRTHLVTGLIFCGLWALSLTLIFPLFRGEYTQYMLSIESGHISYARYAAQYPSANWNPLWYAGFPFHLVYPPAFPYLLAALSRIVPSLSAPQWYRVLTSLMYALGPSTLYLFALHLTGKRLAALATALVYSIAPSPVYLFLSPVRQAAQGFGFAPWRLIAMIFWGEGPHISALTLVPLVALAFLHALRKPSFINLIISSVLIAGVLLTNLFATFALGVILVMELISESFLGKALYKFQTALWIAMLAYALTAFQYDWSFMNSILASSYAHPENALRLPSSAIFILLFLVGGLLFLAVTNYFTGKKPLQPLFIAGSWAFVFGVFVIGFYTFNLSLAPQPFRYIPELQMGVALLVGVIFDRGYIALREGEVFRRRGPMLKHLLSAGYVGLALLLLLGVSLPFIRVSRVITRPGEDIEETPEYQIAMWLDEHIDSKKGERVYVTGTPAFWLNVFTDVMQLRGAADNAQPSHWWVDISYEINKGESGALTTLWLKTMNIRYIVVNYPESGTPWVDFAFPEKLEGLLTVVYSRHGFKIFEVPLASNGLAEVVDLEVIREATIKGPQDEQGLAGFLSTYGGVSGATAEVRYDPSQEPDRLAIEVHRATHDMGILLKMTYDARWKARSEGAALQIERIGPDFMLIAPRKDGDFTVTLQCGKLLTEKMGLVVSCAAILFALVGSIIKAARARALG